MVALAIATQIPSQIDTLEKLHAWSGLCLAFNFPNLTAIEGQGYSERVAQANFFYIAADNRDRLIVRASLPVSNDFKGGGKKQWQFIQEVGNTAIPALFASN